MRCRIANAVAVLLVSGLLVSQAAAETVQLEHDGLTLNAAANRPAGELGAGPVFLVLHGTLAHNGMEIIAALLDVFAEEGVPAVAPTLSLGLDNRSGMYPCDAPHTHCNTDSAKEVRVWIDWLSTQGVERVVLVGHSRGASQVVDYVASAEDDRVAGVALLAPPVSTRAVGEPALLASARELVAAGAGSTLMPVDAFLYCGATQVSARTYLSYYAAESADDTVAMLTRLDLPVDIVFGSDDQVADSAGWLEHAEQFPTSVRITMLDGADHFFRDLYIYDIVEKLLERHSS